MREFDISPRKIIPPIVLLAALLRIPVFLHPHFGMESLYILGIRNNPVSDAISSAVGCGHAPLYFIIMDLWAKISISQYWLLILPMMFSLTTVVLIAVLTARLAGNTAGTIAGFLAAASPLMIQHSASLRYENFSLVMGLLSLYFAYRIMNDESKPADIFAYVISTALGFYFFYYQVYLIIAQNAYFLYRRKSFSRWFTAQVITAALILPWIPVISSQKSEWFGAGNTLVDALKEIFIHRAILNLPDIFITYMTGMFSHIHADDLASRTSLAIAVLLPLLIACAVFVRRKHLNNSWQMVFYFIFIQVAATFTALLINQWKGIPFVPKYTVTFSSGWYLMIAIGLATMKNRNLVRAGLVCVILCYSINLSAYYKDIARPDEFQAVLKKIALEEKDGDIILLSPPFYVSEVQYYYKGKLPIAGYPVNHDPVHNYHGQDITEDQLHARVHDFADYKRIWAFFIMEGADPNPENDIILEELGRMGFVATEEEWPRNHGVVRLFEKNRLVNN